MHSGSRFAHLLSAEHGFDFVFLESSISSQQHHRFATRLRNEHSVERVPMVTRQLARRHRMEVCDVQRPKRHYSHSVWNELRRRARQPERAERKLDSDFPGTCRRQINFR